MANVNSVQKAANSSAMSHMRVLHGTYEITSALSTSDTITFFEAPKGFTVLGGWLVGDDLDTGTEALELDVGDASDTDRFLDSGVITGDAVTGLKPEAGILVPLFGSLKDGPYTYSANTDVIATVTAAANAGGTGTISLILYGTYLDGAVSPPDAPV